MIAWMFAGGFVLPDFEVVKLDKIPWCVREEILLNVSIKHKLPNK